MKKYCGAEDLYRELVEESDQSWLLGLVAFAVVEEQRIEWMRHHEKLNGVLPSPTEVQMWYQQQPASVLLRAKGTAENALQVYSEEVSAVMDGDYRKEIEQGVIVGEIKDLRRFWPQFGVNLAGGFFSALLFALFLMVFAFFVLNDTSPVEIAKDLQQQSTDGP
mgnify:CR=1 FL=1|jgi:hypothetical protein